VAARFPLRGAPTTGDDPLLHAAAPAGLRGPAAAAKQVPDRKVAVVVPVYRGLEITRACLDAALATVPAGTLVVVVDDATPEPALAALLDGLAGTGRIRLLRHAANRGFPAAANAGLRLAARLAPSADLVLLNSDTRPAPGWIEGLRAAVHAAGDIGSATPLSNDATILSYPDSRAANPAPDGPALARLARLAARANAGVAVEVPTGVGFCMYLRRECLSATGVFREDVFAQGYGEENDLCIRARHLGWRHVGVPAAYVAHEGGKSFGAATSPLVARNLAVLERLHPGYGAQIADFQEADPLAGARRRLDALRWQAGRRSGGTAAILVTHDSGGGVERVVRDRCATLRRDGNRVALLRPVADRQRAGAQGGVAYRAGAVRLEDADGTPYPNLVYALPDELPALAKLLRGDRPGFLEVHHLLGHDHGVLRLAALLGIPHDVHLHDYAWFCPRITLLGSERRYCGEPEDARVCDACVADAGSALEEGIGVAALRDRSAHDLATARHVVAPSADTAARMRRHFPGLTPDVARLEDDAGSIAIGRALPKLPPRHDRRRRVAVIGGIGPEKGYDVLLACARDAAARGLALEFVLVGHSHDDRRLLDTGRVRVTGTYREGEGEMLVRAQRPDLAWLPSLWPETWCFTLGVAWRAGLRAAVFDIGAQGERVRASGHGWVLPLGLPAGAINNALLAVDP
jgi:GT2 family glycosyltransferase/glycosyltransferase involved in cell wall biosynthesis